jgi:thiol-disulfide isomerase/thioredoxin
MKFFCILILFILFLSFSYSARIDLKMTSRIKQLCPHPKDFKNAFNSVLELSNNGPNGKIPLYLLFTGEWCPDCQNAYPLITQAFNENSNEYILLECDVKREEYRGNSNYAYRTLPTIAIKCIPTLIKWTDSGIPSRLNDMQCQDIELLRKFISQL